MRASVKKKILIFCLIIASFTAAFFGGRSILAWHIKNKIEQQVYKLRDAGYVVSYDSITVDWKTNSIHVYRFSVKNAIDSTLCRQENVISANFIAGHGLNLRSLLVKRHLSFDKLVLDSPRIAINEKTFIKDSTKRRTRDFVIFVKTIVLPSLQVDYFDSRSCKAGSGYIETASIRDFKLAFYTDQPLFLDVRSFEADSITIRIPHEFYTITIRAIAFKPSLGTFDLDSMKIMPQYDKVAFGRKKGFEIDRIEGTIPYINLSGLKISRGDSLTVSATTFTTQMFLRVFRDKRLPFKRKYKNLPIQALNNLPVGVSIKTLLVNKSYIAYEEHVDDADSSGSVYFDNLYATIRNINNTDYTRRGKTILVAHADFMGQGDVRVRAICPWNTNIRQRVRGTVRNLDMKKLNQMLEPIVQLRVESGHLKQLSFDFTSGPVHSRGKVELDYSGLKLLSFKDQDRVEKILKRKNRRSANQDPDDPKLRKAALKTFLINTFIIRKKIDDHHVDDKRTGAINFERDQARSVFNYWWKSVFTGVKSAYNIEKVQDSKLTKLLKKKHKGEP